MKLYLETAPDAHAAHKILPDADPPPAGFDAATDDITAWDVHGVIGLGDAEIGAAALRDEIAARYALTNWAALTDDEKKIVSSWFVVSKALRTEVHTAAEQQAAGAILHGRLDTNRADDVQTAMALRFATEGVAGADMASKEQASRASTYGSGIDGDVVYTTSQTLTGPVYADQITVNAGVEVRSGGFFVYARTGIHLVDASSAIHDDGFDAVDDVGGAGLASSGYRIVGEAGSNGRNTTGVGAKPANYSGRRDNSQATFARGGAGGAAGAQAGGARASGSTWTAPLTAVQSVYSEDFIRSGGSMWRVVDTTLQRWAIGNGGSAGGCDVATGTATSGGGGGPGGAVHVIAKKITGLGRISANAGKGGDGVQTGDGVAGGGGAGGPGRACVLCESKDSTVTVEAAVAAGGLGAGGGVDGQATETAGLVVVLEAR